MSASAPPAPFSPELSVISGYGRHAGAVRGVSFWRRAGARIIDTIMHYVIGICTGFAIAIFVAIATASHPSSEVVAGLEHRSILGWVSAVLGSIAYHPICEGLHGSTLGKRALSFVVLQENGTPCRFVPALVRSFAYFFDALFFDLGGCLAMQKTPQEQRRGGEWAHTVVCERSQVAPENLRSDGRFALVALLAIMADAQL